MDSVYDEFVEKVTEQVPNVRVGSDDDADIGPVPLLSQTPIIRAHIQDALAPGATVTVGGLDALPGGSPMIRRNSSATICGSAGVPSRNSRRYLRRCCRGSA